MPEIAVHPTPNPNSLKFVSQEGMLLSVEMLSFGSAEEAANHALGAALFALNGVENVFAVPQFITVTKAPAADWNDLVGPIMDALRSFLHGA